MKKGKRVLACGWYGAGNIGDELLLGIVSRWCAERDARLTALSIDPAHTHARHGIEAVDLYDMAAVARAMAQSDLFVLGGGGLFQTHQPLTLPALYDFDVSDVAVYARPVMLARQMGVPVLPWAQGVGPLDDADAREIVRVVFECADHASVRDEASRVLLNTLGIDNPILVAPDPVWALPVEVRSEKKSGGPRRLCLTVRSWPFVEDWEDAFAAALKATVDPADTTLVWLPFQAHAVPGRVTSELDLVRAMMQRMSGAGDFDQELVLPINDEHAVEIIAGCDALVAMRLHAQILGLKVGVPTFCLRYDAKMAIAGEQAGMQPGSGIDIDADPADWINVLRTWWADGAPATPLPPGAADMQAQQALVHRDCLHEAIDRSGRKRGRWEADFDWLGAWQQKTNDVALQRRDHALLRLNDMLLTAHSAATDVAKSTTELMQTLAMRDSEIQRLAGELIKAETTVSAMVVERDAQMVARDAALAERDAIQADRDARLAEQNAELAKRDIELARRDAALVERDEALSSSRSAYAELRETVQHGRGRIAEIEAELLVTLARANELKHVVQARDTEVMECRLRIDHLVSALQAEREKLEARQREVNDLRSSTSWRLTRPLRFVRYLFRDPKFAISQARKTLFSRQSPGSEVPLESFVEPSIQLQLQEASPAVLREGDLSWIEFVQQVLSRRGQYKGVFIQEVIIDWDVPLYQRPQHMATAMARLGYLVIYRTCNGTVDYVEGFREIAANLWLTNRLEVDQIKGAVRSVYSTAYMQDPASLRNRFPDSVIVYEYIDHIDPQISGDSDTIRGLMSLRDWAFGGGADFIITSARQLEREACAAVGRDRVLLVQNGVDTSHYRDQRHQAFELPCTLSDFRARYAEVVGYFGALAPWLWYEEIAKLVAARPDIGFVFIGPDYFGGAAQLPQAANVLYLGTIDYQVLPAYARQFDVCFIPFAPGEIARTTSPLKLFEYFALEKPVVVTSEMLECVAHPEVFSGSNAEELSMAIDQAISVKSDPVMARRMAQLADENDWDNRARALEVVFSRAQLSM